MLPLLPTQFLDNLHFHNFCATLRPGYVPVCPTTARTSQLPAEYAHCVLELHKKLQQEENLTINADGWTDTVKRAILGILVVFADGSKSLLRSFEHSAADHTGATVLLLFACSNLVSIVSSTGGDSWSPDILCSSICMLHGYVQVTTWPR